MGGVTSRLCGNSSPTLALSDICQRMRCLVACCGSEVHIDLRDASDEYQKEAQKNMKKRSSNQKNRLLEKLYYELDRPSALGGVDKLYRAARRYGINRSQVLEWSQQSNCFWDRFSVAS